MSRSRLTEAVSIFPSDDSFKAIFQYFLELGVFLFQGQNISKSSQASRKLCELLEPGLGAIFGPTSPSAANHVQSVSQALHVPFVETRWRQIERDHALRQLEGGSMTWWQQLIASTSTHTRDTWDRLLQTLSKRWDFCTFLLIATLVSDCFQIKKLLCHICHKRLAGGAWSLSMRQRRAW